MPHALGVYVRGCLCTNITRNFKQVFGRGLPEYETGRLYKYIDRCMGISILYPRTGFGLNRKPQSGFGF